MAGYSGFPSCINGMNALKEVLDERKNQGIDDRIGKIAIDNSEIDRLKLGEQELSKLDDL